MTNTFCFQQLKCEDVLRFFASYSELNTFGLLVGRNTTCEDVSSGFAKLQNSDHFD